MTGAGTPVRVKICGITRVEDALLAASLGAWAVGFVFHPASPRRADPGRVLEITRALPPRVETVGVFVDLPVRGLLRLARAAGVRIAQLHGNEGPEALRELGKAGMRTLKALRLREPAQLEELGRFSPSEGFLLDAAVQGAHGGTGELADWKLAREARLRLRGRPLILSGGLRPGNVASAISEVRPWAVDVASGVEESPGVKCAEKLREFFVAAGRPFPPGEGS